MVWELKNWHAPCQNADCSVVSTNPELLFRITSKDNAPYHTYKTIRVVGTTNKNLNTQSQQFDVMISNNLDSNLSMNSIG